MRISIIRLIRFHASQMPGISNFPGLSGQSTPRGATSRQSLVPISGKLNATTMDPRVLRVSPSFDFEKLCAFESSKSKAHAKTFRNVSE